MSKKKLKKDNERQIVPWLERYELQEKELVQYQIVSDEIIQSSKRRSPKRPKKNTTKVTYCSGLSKSFRLFSIL